MDIFIHSLMDIFWMFPGHQLSWHRGQGARHRTSSFHRFSNRRNLIGSRIAVDLGPRKSLTFVHLRLYGQMGQAVTRSVWQDSIAVDMSVSVAFKILQ